MNTAKKISMSAINNSMAKTMELQVRSEYAKKRIEFTDRYGIYHVFTSVRDFMLFQAESNMDMVEGNA